MEHDVCLRIVEKKGIDIPLITRVTNSLIDFDNKVREVFVTSLLFFNFNFTFFIKLHIFRLRYTN